MPWQKPIRAYFRRGGDGWQLVGVDRPTEPSKDRAAASANPLVR